MDLRPSISGTWYPSDADELRSLLQHLLDLHADEAGSVPARVRGLLVPHARLAYSGNIAAKAYASLAATSYDTVVVLGPFHAYHRAPFLICQHDGYQTPLGPVAIDHKQVRAIHTILSERSGMGLTPTDETAEHSIEIQLPFLQTILGTFRLVPIMLAHQTPTTVAALSGALIEAIGDADPLLIASSDLSHFNPQHLAVLFDREMLNRITAYQAQAVLHAELEGAGSACGAGAIASMLMVAHALGASHSRLLGYGTSGDVTGDFNSVIGYAADAFW